MRTFVLLMLSIAFSACVVDTDSGPDRHPYRDAGVVDTGVHGPCINCPR